MPMIPHVSVPTPEHYIAKGMPIPALCSGRNTKSDFRRRMERMAVSKTDALIFDNVEERKINSLRACVVSYVTGIKEQFPGRSYEIRVITQGVIKTVAVWRVA